ncbi:hypothetical protein SUVZ_11G1150 [Saccharomyces uvarum]|uniref:non-specific serine/threonine protein kinase n=1 Tax=Saccharomyces uvarum TaxID=230603 RepID=A0ABN8WFR9_SACUV|nr:hypothetical protein SUVZ_11G1150 [Saccharomyces uvarum]
MTGHVSKSNQKPKGRPSSLARKAAKRAMAKVNSNPKRTSAHLERVVQSVNDATKRLSQPESTVSVTTKSSKRKSRDTVGPWKLGKTLGKGSSGRVRLAKNMETGQLAAIKIVPKKKAFVHRSNNGTVPNSYSSSMVTSNVSSPSIVSREHSNHSQTNPYGIEREIVIMKLISHANVMALFEVWENKSELYLVLEYVDGGELFDYLVSRGKLPEREAIHYFKQIVEGVSYCHSFNICHRDLKPENLLLDKKNKKIKIADFGMAALELPNKLLKTSCGSPHYASPEIVMGRPYHGGPSDVWSCGIVLFALLTGHLPFNDDNIKKLLLKVQSGKYQMPMNLSAEARDLISKILVIDPEKRITTQEILEHPLIKKYDNLPVTRMLRKMKRDNMTRGKSNSDLHLLDNVSPSIVTLNTKNEIDESILRSLQILWHGVSRELITAKLLQKPMSEEKLFYSLLLQYKQRHSISLSLASETQKAAKETGMNESKIESTLELPNSSNSRSDIDVKTLHSSEAHSENTPEFDPHDDINTNAGSEMNAPVLAQKSQFSINTLSQRGSDKYEAEVPTLPPAIPIFSASSARVFRNSFTSISSRSRKSLRLSSSKLSLSASTSRETMHENTLPLPLLPKSPSRYSLSKKAIHSSPSNKSLLNLLPRNHIAPNTTVRRTLQNSASKRSLYSLQSISKRSLNLKDILVFDDPLPSKMPETENTNKSKSHSFESDSDFEILCDQILFGNALDKILEEEEDNEKQKDLPKLWTENTKIPTATTMDVKVSMNKENEEPEKNSAKIEKDLSNILHNQLEENSKISSFAMFQDESTPSNSVLEAKKPERAVLSDITSSFNKANDDFFKSEKLAMEKKNRKARPLKKNAPLLSPKPTQTQSQRVNSLPGVKGKTSLSLDPRRNISQPVNSKVESLLQGLKPKRGPPSHWSHESGSLFADGHKADEHPDKALDNTFESSCVPSTMVATDSTDPSVLAESSTIHKPMLSLPSTFLNTSMTFKNLSQMLAQEDNDKHLSIPQNQSRSVAISHPLRKQSTKISLTPRSNVNTNLSIKRNQSSTGSYMSNDLDEISDMTFAMEIPTNTFTAHAVQLINSGSGNNTAGASPKISSFTKDKGSELADYVLKENRAVNSKTNNIPDYSAPSTHNEGAINIFEDAPSDEGSLNTSSSESDSQGSVHRKAVSIDTLTTTTVLTPATNVRVSLYWNNNNAGIPRETTEEILSKIQLSPEKPPNPYVQKRFSSARGSRDSDALGISQSVKSMFKDLEEDQDDHTSQADMLTSSLNYQNSKLSEENTNPKQRVTMLFDEEEEESKKIGSEKIKEELTNLDNKIDEEPAHVSLSPVTNKERHVDVTGNNYLKAPKPLPTKAAKEPALRTASAANTKGLENTSKSANKSKVKDAPGNDKKNWFVKLLQNFSSHNSGTKISNNHETKISFDEVHILTLNEFNKNSIDYQLKNLDHKFGKKCVEYDCKFVKGNFKFKIKISTLPNASTIITVKRRSRNANATSDRAFEKFNNDVERVIRNAGRA